VRWSVEFVPSFLPSFERSGEPRLYNERTELGNDSKSKKVVVQSRTRMTDGMGMKSERRAWRGGSGEVCVACV